MERYEYEIIEIVDNNDGAVDWKAMKEKLNALGAQGWRLVVGFSNELGSNTSVIIKDGKKQGTNSTIDQNILIFERKIEVEKSENEE